MKPLFKQSYLLLFILLFQNVFPSFGSVFSSVNKTISTTSGSITPKLMNTIGTVAASKVLLPEVKFTSNQALKGSSSEPSQHNVPKRVQNQSISAQSSSLSAKFHSALPISSTNYQKSITSVQPTSSQNSPGLFNSLSQLNPLSQPNLSFPTQQFSGPRTISPSVSQTKAVPCPASDSLSICNSRAKFGNPCQSTISVNANSGSNSVPLTLSDGSGHQIPINLQINVPPPTVEGPKITIISAKPSESVSQSNTNECNDRYTAQTPYENCPPYPMPPIILKKPKSKRKCKSWLPLLLLAVAAGDRGSCNCPYNEGVPIPIPVPVPL